MIHIFLGIIIFWWIFLGSLLPLLVVWLVGWLVGFVVVVRLEFNVVKVSFSVEIVLAGCSFCGFWLLAVGC